MINESLFEGELIRLAPPDPDKDPEIESHWTHDPDYLRSLGPKVARPLAPVHVKKQYEELEKEKGVFHFAVRAKADDRLIGFVRLDNIEWNNGVGNLSLGIGDPNDRGHGYGGEVLRMVLRYAFAELNLFRLGAVAPGYNTRAIAFLERAGFVVEVRRREAIERDGKRWDVVGLGLLKDDWERRK